MEVTFCATKAGKGFKIVVDGVWLYTSKHELYRVLQNKALACQFREIDKEVAQEQQVEIPVVQEITIWDGEKVVPYSHEAIKGGAGKCH